MFKGQTALVQKSAMNSMKKKSAPTHQFTTLNIDFDSKTAEEVEVFKENNEEEEEKDLFFNAGENSVKSNLI